MYADAKAATTTTTTTTTTTIQEDTRPFQNFIKSLKSDETKQAYKRCLLKYLSYSNLTPEKMLSLPVGEIQDKLIDYILSLNKQDLSTSFINLNYCAMKHFYAMNDIILNTVKIGKFLGESKKKNVDRGYTDKG